MPRLTKIYTRTGDDGTTALGLGARVPKDALRVDCYGTVDELNAALGVVVALPAPTGIREDLMRIQNDLFHLGADLCVTEEQKSSRPLPRIEERHVLWLEEIIDRRNENLAPLANFVLPGGSPAAAQLHVARTICRRGERLLVALARREAVGEWALPYLNRLSDALFVLSREANQLAGVAEPLWDSRS
jgi:cob(I)alamin adenosyltransferase